MANNRSPERAGGNPRALRAEPGAKDEDEAVLKAAEIVLLAHDRCVRMSCEQPLSTGLAATVEPVAYAEAREFREQALRKLMETRVRGRRGLSAKKIALGVVVAWLGSEDPNCAHAMRLLEEYDLAMSDGKNSSDPALAALRAIWLSRNGTPPKSLCQAGDRGPYS